METSYDSHVLDHDCSGICWKPGKFILQSYFILSQNCLNLNPPDGTEPEHIPLLYESKKFS